MTTAAEPPQPLWIVVAMTDADGEPTAARYADARPSVTPAAALVLHLPRTDTSAPDRALTDALDRASAKGVSVPELVRRLRGGCPQVAGAGSVGEAVPDPAAAAGERVDPVPPERRRAGGVTAVIQRHPREARGRSASVTTQVTSYSKPFENRLCPVNLGAGLRPAGSASQAAPMHSGLRPPTRVTSATTAHTSSSRAATTGR